MVSNTLFPVPQTDEPCHFTNYEARRRAAIQLTSECCHSWFDREGKWIHPVQLTDAGDWLRPPQPLPRTFNRLMFWLSMGLFAGEKADVELGNLIWKDLPLYLRTPGDDSGRPAFDIFVTNHSMQMLALHGDKLSPDVCRKLEDWAQVGLREYRGNRQCDLQFHGFNDNMPAKATLGLILGGEYFGDHAALEHGLWNLRQFRDLLSRRGLISEYNSPTYTPFTIVNLTEIAQKTGHDEARELASACVERIWADIYAHFHTPTGMVAGPYSRAYHFDSVGHLSSLSFLLWLVHGDQVILNPLEEFRRKPIRLLHAHGFCPESLGRLSWIASCELRPPEYLAEWHAQREYPFQVRATAERGGDESNTFPAEVSTCSYQEEDFSLGTAQGEAWTEKQSEAFYLTWRRCRPAARLEDIRVGYLKYLINEEAPHDPDESIPTHGCVHALQDRRTALVLVRPSLSLVGKPITKLKLSVLLPQHFGPHDHVEIRENHLFLEDGPVRLAIRPLNSTIWGGNGQLRLEKESDYLLVSMYNYAGEARIFTESQLGRTMNGFACVIGLCEEESSEEFQDKVLSSTCVDTWNFGMRTVRYQTPDTLLEMAYAPATNHIRYAALNGRLYPRPTWQADELPAEDLPFLGQNARPNSVTLPYRHLRVSWASQAPWIIASNGPRQSVAQSPSWPEESAE